MKRVTFVLGAIATAGAAQAGGIGRSVNNTGLLFESGNYFEFSLGEANPNISGVQAIPFGPFPAGAASGNMAKGYTNLSFGVKMALSDALDMAVTMDQPIGADVSYAPGTGYIYGGSTATIKSNAVTAMLRYKINPNISVFGGLKSQQVSGKVALFNGYTMSTSQETDYGYLVGAAYEKPEIALRVALTYSSPITHKFAVMENGGPSLPFETEVPKSIALDFQSGVAKDTLVFGSIRWREWSAFDISPVGYVAAAGEPLVSYDDDTTTVTLGVGRPFTENWAGALQISHEKSNGGFAFRNQCQLAMVCRRGILFFHTQRYSESNLQFTKPE